MRFLRSAALGLAGLMATYALKKAMSKLEQQMADARVRAEAARQPRDLKEVKRLRQDPVTGVYYAED